MASELHPFCLVDPSGRTVAMKSFYNYRDAAGGFGLSDYLVSQGWAVLQLDAPQSPHHSIT